MNPEPHPVSSPQVDVCKRHKWEYVGNVRVVRIGLRTGSMTLRGLYRCKCGERKHGQPQFKSEPVAALSTIGESQ